MESPTLEQCSVMRPDSKFIIVVDVSACVDQRRQAWQCPSDTAMVSYYPEYRLVVVRSPFHEGGKCDLVVLDRALNQINYRKILDETMLPFASGAIWNNFVLEGQKKLKMLVQIRLGRESPYMPQNVCPAKNLHTIWFQKRTHPIQRYVTEEISNIMYDTFRDVDGIVQRFLPQNRHQYRVKTKDKREKKDTLNAHSDSPLYGSCHLHLPTGKISLYQSPESHFTITAFNCSEEEGIVDRKDSPEGGTHSLPCRNPELINAPMPHVEVRLSRSSYKVWEIDRKCKFCIIKRKKGCVNPPVKISPQRLSVVRPQVGNVTRLISPQVVHRS
ncbi:hypothetical protein GQR58_018707 [Nymphon striatum]|nr:hypothetical protein GQR58_018707 [Nymphon striatum]